MLKAAKTSFFWLGDEDTGASALKRAEKEVSGRPPPTLEAPTATGGHQSGGTQTDWKAKFTVVILVYHNYFRICFVNTVGKLCFGHVLE